MCSFKLSACQTSSKKKKKEKKRKVAKVKALEKEGTMLAQVRIKCVMSFLFRFHNLLLINTLILCLEFFLFKFFKSNRNFIR